MIPPLVEACVAAFGLYQIYRYLKARQKPLPPGPPGLPLIGNLLDLPKSSVRARFTEYKQKYGPISSLSVMSETIIIINDQKIALDLLDKRSTTYSDRSITPFMKLAGWSPSTIQQPYGHGLMWRRKSLRQFIGTKTALLKVHPMHWQEIEAHRWVVRLAKNPDDFVKNIRLMTASIVLKVSHGYNVDTTKEDPMVLLVEHTMKVFSEGIQTGKYLVDVIPALRFVPEWMPGAGFKQFAKYSKKCADELVNLPYKFVKQQMVAGTAYRSFASHFLEQSLSEDEEKELKWTAAGLYAAGTDTTVSALQNFFLIMQLYPEVQLKAQAEIDSVVGLDRLPTFDDKLRLPYVEAIVKEILRWNPMVPLCVPHITREDDIYEGYFIPKGSRVIVNIWAINHDPENFTDPMTFNPDRFLATGDKACSLDSYDVTFGYGRRICPGRDLADATLFMAVATCLATLNVSKYVGEDGREVEPELKITDGFVAHPIGFKCRITHRSERTKELLQMLEDSDEGSDSTRASDADEFLKIQALG